MLLRVREENFWNLSKLLLVKGVAAAAAAACMTDVVNKTLFDAVSKKISLVGGVRDIRYTHFAHYYIASYSPLLNPWELKKKSAAAARGFTGDTHTLVHSLAAALRRRDACVYTKFFNS